MRKNREFNYLPSLFIKVDKFDVDKKCLMFRGGFLSHDLLQSIPGRLILIV